MTAFRRTQPLIAAAASFAILIASPAARAQEETVYIGGASPRGTVQVDMSVLDEIGGGAAAGGQTLRAPGLPGSQRIVLTPPGQKAPQASSPRRTTTAKPVAPRKAPAPTSKAKAPTKSSAPAPSAPAAVASDEPKAIVAAPAADTPPPPPTDLAMPASAPPVPTVAKTAETARAAKPVEPTRAPAPAPTPVLAAVEPASSPAARLPETESKPAATAAATTPVAMSSDPKPTQAPAVARAAEPKPATTAAAPSKPSQTAALPPAPQGSAGKQSMRIPFSGEAAALPDSAKGDLKQIAGQLSKDPALRVQVMAYAGGGDDASKARRLSLSRALAVRSYLIEQGIGSTRIDVRALGNSAEGGPADRVDLMMVSR